MARGSNKGPNTGPNNYPAGKVPGGASYLKKVAESITPPRFPNRNLSTTQYKRGLKKEESDV